jgi:hypothetical protein
LFRLLVALAQVKLLQDFFLEVELGIRRAAPRLSAAKGQAVEIFVELTCGEVRRQMRPLLP